MYTVIHLSNVSSELSRRLKHEIRFAELAGEEVSCVAEAIISLDLSTSDDVGKHFAQVEEKCRLIIEVLNLIDSQDCCVVFKEIDFGIEPTDLANSNMLSFSIPDTLLMLSLENSIKILISIYP